MAKKAYIVTEDEGGTGGVIFAETAIEARKYGANEYNGGELGGMHARRAKGLDRYYGVGVPASIMVEDYGWRFECSECGWYIDSDTQTDIIGNEGGCVYCSIECAVNDHAEKYERKLYDGIMREQFEDRLKKKYSDIDITRAHVYSVGRGRGRCIQEMFVYFKFPGQSIGDAVMKYRTDKIGPVQPELWCCAGDKDAFEAWQNG